MDDNVKIKGWIIIVCKETTSLVTFYQVILEKYPLGQERPDVELLPSVPPAQKNAPQSAVV